MLGDVRLPPMKIQLSRTDPGLCIAWWNTGLAPPRGRRPVTDAHIDVAAGVLQHLIEDNGADLIALAEMSEDCAHRLRARCEIARTEFTWLKAFVPAGRGRFSLCVLSRTRRLQVTLIHPIIKKEGNAFIKVGLHFSVQPHHEDEYPFTLIASHWPSRLHMDRHDSERTHIAAHLRRWIDDHIPSIEDVSNVLLIGDFNDEPFDEGLERYLHASRDREKVRRNPRLLYNPFWRHLSSFQPEAPACAQADPGTYLHHGGTCSRWRTFDQVIVSSAVLFGRSGWRLNEADTRVASVPQLDLERPPTHRVFDHLPIVGHLERYFA